MIDRNHLLLDAPVRRRAGASWSIGAGFVGFEAEANRIDCRGSTEANLIVLPGHHYGSRVAGNTLIGRPSRLRADGLPDRGPRPIRLVAHLPIFDLRFEDNTIVDPADGGLVAVWHGEAINANRGRRYLTAEIFSNNTFRWTDDGPAIGRDGPKALTIGAGPSLDPGELSLRMGSNAATAPDGRAVADPLTIVVGTVNGRTYRALNGRRPVPRPRPPRIGEEPFRERRGTGTPDRTARLRLGEEGGRQRLLRADARQRQRPDHHGLAACRRSSASRGRSS